MGSDVATLRVRHGGSGVRWLVLGGFLAVMTPILALGAGSEPTLAGKVLQGFWPAASGVGALLAGVLFVRALTRRDYLVIDGDQLVVPGTVASPRPRVVPIPSIRAVAARRLYGMRWMRVDHAGGRLEIPAGMLAKGGFNDVLQALRVRRGQADPRTFPRRDDGAAPTVF